MANCRIQNLKPPCGYVTEGIRNILLLDFEDFKGFRFEDDKTYDTARISAILRISDWVETQAPDTAKYSSNFNNKLYTHQIESFISELSAEMQASLHLATKRRFIPAFETNGGRWFTFGYDAGATVSYANQTADGAGSLITITAASIYPLFEATEGAINASTAEWILQDGIWNYYNEFWFNNGIWKF